MKKIILLSLMVAVALIGLTGCAGELSAKERLLEASKKATELDSLKMQATIDLEFEQNGIKVGMGFDLDSKLDNINNNMYSLMKMEFLGTNVEAEMYMHSSDDKVELYTSTQGEGWTKTTEQRGKEANQDDAAFDMIDIIANGSSIEKQDYDVKNIDHYVVTLDKSSIKELLTYFNQLSNSGNITESTEIVKDDMLVDIYINKDNYVTKMSIDFADAMGFTDENSEASVNKMMLEYNFSDFNQVGTVTIPESVIKNAIEQ